MNALNDVNPDVLLGNSFAPPSTHSWLNKSKTDLLGKVALQPLTLKITFEELKNNGVARNYYQRRLNMPSNWSLWHAIRDSHQWGDGTSHDTYYMNGYGSTFEICSDCYQASTHSLSGGEIYDGSMGFWDSFYLKSNDGNDYLLSKHAGLLCDAIGNRGNQWIFTSNPNDSRYKNENRVSKTIVWIK